MKTNTQEQMFNCTNTNKNKKLNTTPRKTITREEFFNSLNIRLL